MSDRPVDRDAIRARIVSALHFEKQWADAVGGPYGVPPLVKEAADFARDAAALLDALEAADESVDELATELADERTAHQAAEARVVLLEAQRDTLLRYVRATSAGRKWADRYLAAVSVADSGPEEKKGTHCSYCGKEL